MSAKTARETQYTASGWWGTRTLHDQFSDSAEGFPSRCALVDAPDRTSWTGGEPQRLDYQALNAKVMQWSLYLQAEGVKPGDIVLTQLPNIHELVVLLLACFRVGAIISPVLVQFDQNELNQICDQLKPKLIVTTTWFKKRNLTATLLPIADRLGAPCWLCDEPSSFPDTSHVVDAIQAVPTGNDIATICWTSGTEGAPKGVMRSHNQWLATGRLMAESAQLCDGDTLLNTRPLVNMAAIGGSLCSWLLCAGTFVLHHPLDMHLAVQQICSERINVTFMPPAFIVALLKDPELRATADLSSLRVLGSGSAAIPDWAILEFEQEFNVSLINFFGSNEGIGLVSTPSEIPDPLLRATLFPRFGVDGFDWPSLPTASEMITKLVDIETDTEITEPNISGELRVQGSTIFDQYFGSPETTLQAFDAQGFYRSGDLFEIAGKGELAKYYRFVGRCKEVIIRGGFNIAPAELDNLLSEHPAITEVAAYGYPDDRLGEKVGVAAVVRDGHSLTLEDITGYLRERHVAVFKLPEHLLVLTELPRNGLLKVLRRELTNMHKERAL
jgi:acyl-CoA synthetase (AMP-forming)/AMP-acid ligase II